MGRWPSAEMQQLEDMDLAFLSPTNYMVMACAVMAS